MSLLMRVMINEDATLGKFVLEFTTDDSRFVSPSSCSFHCLAPTTTTESFSSLNGHAVTFNKAAALLSVNGQYAVFGHYTEIATALEALIPFSKLSRSSITPVPSYINHVDAIENSLIEHTRRIMTGYIQQSDLMVAAVAHEDFRWTEKSANVIRNRFKKWLITPIEACVSRLSHPDLERTFDDVVRGTFKMDT